MKLLDYLARESHCVYLSDLGVDRLAKRMPADLPKLIKDADASRWTLDEWKEAVAYMTREESAENTVEGCRQQLLRICHEEKP